MIELAAISKRFGTVPVLRAVTLGLGGGRTLGLVGENGAGKSTLMNILGGSVLPDSGTMHFDGKPYAPRSPADAAAKGIAFIHQELNLFPNLTVAENLLLAGGPRRWGFLIDRKARERRAAELLEQVGLEIPPGLPLERLSAGERQLVEIAKALGANARLLILDEPTTSLSHRESEILFGLMGRMRSRGMSLIFISHILGDVLRLCDRIAVLRDGAVVANGEREEFTIDKLVSSMAGRSVLYQGNVRRAAPHPEVVLDARNIGQRGMLSKIQFQLRRGEILGISGLMGAGRSELARILFGLDPCETGELLLLGEPIQHLTSRERIRRGLAFLTENRREEGLCLEASVSANAALAALPRFARGALKMIDSRSVETELDRLSAAVNLKAGSRHEPVRQLSGGNQQKVVLAKWLLLRPRVLILDEPTRGIDVAAKAEIHQLIGRLAEEGAAILLISSELEELFGLCDRILVLDRGSVCDELPRSEFDRERILRGALESRAAARGAAKPA